MTAASGTRTRLTAGEAAVVLDALDAYEAETTWAADARPSLLMVRGTCRPHGLFAAADVRPVRLSAKRWERGPGPLLTELAEAAAGWPATITWWLTGLPGPGQRILGAGLAYLRGVYAVDADGRQYEVLQTGAGRHRYMAPLGRLEQQLAMPRALLTLASALYEASG